MSKHELRPWAVLAEEKLFSRPPYIEVSGQRIELPDGRRVDDFYQVEMVDFATVFAETTDGKVLIMRCYRHGVRRICLNFPGGHLSSGEDALAGVKRELLEETGYEAAEWHRLGSYVTNANYRCQTAYFFRATGCRQVAEANSGDLEEIELLLLSRDEVLAAARRGDFAIASQIALLALATHPVLSDMR